MKNNEIIRCSEEHSFYTNEIGYMMAKELKKGYTLMALNNIAHEIVEVKREYYEEEVELYNIYLEDKNNFFVSGLKVMIYLMTLSVSFDFITKDDVVFCTA